MVRNAGARFARDGGRHEAAHFAGWNMADVSDSCPLERAIGAAAGFCLGYADWRSGRACLERPPWHVGWIGL